MAHAIAKAPINIARPHKLAAVPLTLIRLPRAAADLEGEATEDRAEEVVVLVPRLLTERAVVLVLLAWSSLALLGGEPCSDALLPLPLPRLL